MTFVITSPAFTHEGAIPAAFTCEGDDRSPALEARYRQLALDAPFAEYAADNGRKIDEDLACDRPA